LKWFGWSQALAGVCAGMATAVLKGIERETLCVKGYPEKVHEAIGSLQPRIPAIYIC